MTTDDDRELMRRIQQGESALFARLVDKYERPLYRFAVSKLGGTHRAEDVVQEGFLAAFAARDSYNPQFAFSTWLWTILINLCRTHLRKQSRHRTESLSPTAEVVADEPAVPDGLRQLLVQERTQQLSRLLDELPEPQADAIRLRFFGSLSFDEIAAAMECSLSGAKKRVKTGLLTLSEKLRDWEEPET